MLRRLRPRSCNETHVYCRVESGQLDSYDTTWHLSSSPGVLQSTYTILILHLSYYTNVSYRMGDGLDGILSERCLRRMPSVVST